MENVDAIVVLLMLTLYFLPTIIAVCRHSYYMAAAIVVNLFLGWTLIGWLLALILSLQNKPKTGSQQIVINTIVGDKNDVKPTKTEKEE